MKLAIESAMPLRQNESLQIPGCHIGTRDSDTVRRILRNSMNRHLGVALHARKLSSNQRLIVVDSFVRVVPSGVVTVVRLVSLDGPLFSIITGLSFSTMTVLGGLLFFVLISMEPSPHPETINKLPAMRHPKTVLIMTFPPMPNVMGLEHFVCQRNSKRQPQHCRRIASFLEMPPETGH